MPAKAYTTMYLLLLLTSSAAVTRTPKCTATISKLDTLRQESIPKWTAQWDREDELQWSEVRMASLEALIAFTPFDELGNVLGVGSAVLAAQVAHTGIIEHDRISLELAKVVADTDACFDELATEMQNIRDVLQGGVLSMVTGAIKTSEKDRLVEIRKLGLYRKAVRTPCSSSSHDLTSVPDATCCDQSKLDQLYCGESTWMHSCSTRDLATCNGNTNEVQLAWEDRLALIGCTSPDSGLFGAVKATLQLFSTVADTPLIEDSLVNRAEKLKVLVLVRSHLHVVFEALRNAIRAVQLDLNDPSVRKPVSQMNAVCRKHTIPDYLEKVASMLVDLHQNYFGLAREGNMGTIGGQLYHPLTNALHQVIGGAVIQTLSDDDFGRLAGAGTTNWHADQASKYCDPASPFGLCVGGLPAAGVTSYTSENPLYCTDQRTNIIPPMTDKVSGVPEGEVDEDPQSAATHYRCVEQDYWGNSVCQTIYRDSTTLGRPPNVPVEQSPNRIPANYCSAQMSHLALLDTLTAWSAPASAPARGLPGFVPAGAPQAPEFMLSECSGAACRACGLDFQLSVPTRMMLYRSRRVYKCYRRWGPGCDWKPAYYMSDSIDLEMAFCPSALEFHMYPPGTDFPDGKVALPTSDLRGSKEELVASLSASVDRWQGTGPGLTQARIEAKLFGDPTSETQGAYAGTMTAFQDPTAPLALYWPQRVSREIDSLVQSLTPDTCAVVTCPAYIPNAPFGFEPGQNPLYVKRDSVDGVNRDNLKCQSNRCWTLADQNMCCMALWDVCFDAATTLETKSGPKRADQIQVGDSVLVATHEGKLVWDRIAVDASHGPGMTNYLQITTSSGASVVISGNHYLHAVSHSDVETVHCCGSSTLKLASNVSVGDYLWTVAEVPSIVEGERARVSRVTSIQPVQREGKFNFLLEQAGDSHFRSLLASGVVASSFTSDWRLLGTFGFEAADKLRDDLRELSLIAAESHERYSPRNSSLMQVLRSAEMITADCIEAHMANCSEAEIRSKFAILATEASTMLGPQMSHSVNKLTTALAEKHLMALPTVARPMASRMLSMVASAASVNTVVWVAAHEARTLAIQVCNIDEKCAHDLQAHDRNHVPSWAVALLVISVVILILAATLAALVCRYVLKRRHLQTTAAPVSDTTTSQPTLAAAAVATV